MDRTWRPQPGDPPKAEYPAADPLEETQDIQLTAGPGVWSHGDGVWRRTWPEVFYRRSHD